MRVINDDEEKLPSVLYYEVCQRTNSLFHPRLDFFSV